jgi:uncharacterized membrane protein YcaP (DUF421 family)
MNAIDLVVTVALGSTLATVLLAKDVALAEGALAFALLISPQFAVTWFSVRAVVLETDGSFSVAARLCGRLHRRGSTSPLTIQNQ